MTQRRKLGRHLAALDRKTRKIYGHGTCLAPSEWHSHCQGSIIRAHTVPRSSLQRIARDGHVYALVHSLASLDRNRGQPTPELVGVHRASTFSGFCRHHDNHLFRPIEKSTFVGSSEQCFLLAFRALAREVHGKRSEWRNFNETLADIGARHAIPDYGRGLEAGVANIREHMHDYASLLVANDYSSVRAYVIEFKAAPPVMCSGAIYPECDFHGGALQNLADLNRKPDLLCFSSYFCGQRGVVLFSWLPESDPSCSEFLQDFAAVPNRDLGPALVHFLFEYSDNILLAPDWWDALSPRDTGELLRRIRAGTPFGPLHRALSSDAVDYTPWPVTDRYWVNAPSRFRAQDP